MYGLINIAWVTSAFQVNFTDTHIGSKWGISANTDIEYR